MMGKHGARPPPTSSPASRVNVNRVKRPGTKPSEAPSLSTLATKPVLTIGSTILASRRLRFGASEHY